MSKEKSYCGLCGVDMGDSPFVYHEVCPKPHLKRPGRPVEINISIGANSDKDVIATLEQIAFEFETKGVRGKIVSGGVSANFIIDEKRDPQMTADRYNKEIQEYVDTLRERRK